MKSSGINQRFLNYIIDDYIQNEKTPVKTMEIKVTEMSLDIGPFWELRSGPGPLVGVALHAGHNLRSEVVPLLAIDEERRFREEDPYSDYWTLVCGTQLLTLRSRFEVDLNRPREQAVYRTPEDAWGIQVWTNPVDESVVEASLAEHDRFYKMLEKALSEIEARYGHFIVLDFHSYNHRRDGPGEAQADPASHPEINVGTGSMNRQLWAGVVNGFIREVRNAGFLGRQLDVRENINFRGRYLAEFVHTHFPGTGCVLAIEVKKIFMDEWTGLADTRQVAALHEAFRRGVAAILQELEGM